MKYTNKERTNMRHFTAKIVGITWTGHQASAIYHIDADDVPKSIPQDDFPSVLDCEITETERKRNRNSMRKGNQIITIDATITTVHKKWDKCTNQRIWGKCRLDSY